MQGYRRFFFPIALATIIFQGCDKTDLYSGTGVSFNASSKGVDTKVSYGGTQNSLRAINWAQGDQISIYCQEAFDIKTSTYTVGSDITPDGTSSIAKGVVASGEPLKWNGNKEHNFYCVYPAVNIGVTEGVSSSGWSGSIPATQEYNGGDYSDLSPYMMLVGYTKSDPQPKVDVDFYPITTCLEFEMMNNGDCDLTVNSVTLTSSDDKPLSGEFSVSCNGSVTDADSFVTNTTSTDKSVTVGFGTNGISFKNGKAETLSFKMFLNPAHNITEPYLTIKAKRTDGASIILSTQLKISGRELVFTKKHITPLTGILVEGGILLTTFAEPTLLPWSDDHEDDLTVSDEYQYFLEVVDNPDKTITFDDSGLGLTKTLKVKSYREDKDGNMTAIMPSLKFSDDPFVGTNPTISGPTAECVYDIVFIADENEPKVSTVDISSSLKNATSVINHDLSSGGTANCYVVKAPGTYKFEIAYGNKTKYDSTYDGKTKKPAGSTVDVLWQTPANLITADESPSDGYITFEVKKDNIQQGNALIVLKNGSTITWSWHIWFTDADVSTVPLGYYSTGTRTVTTYSKRECTVDVSNSYDPLGFSKATITMSQGEDKEETTENISSGCTYYQWGRKDPFRYDTEIEQFRQSIQNSCEIDDLVQNPTCLYLYAYDKSYGVDCYRYHDQYYWNPSTKTVFDPSPVGMRVKKFDAKSDDYSSLVTGCYKIGNNSTVYGQYDYIIQSGGPLMFWSSESISTTSDKVNAKCASKDVFYASTNSPITSRANAYCVLCVAE